MNRGAYRAAPPAPGLPLPRTSLLALTLVVGGCAAVAVPLAPLLLVPAGIGPASAANAWRVFRDGGMVMWLLLLLDVVAVLGAAALGALALRGKSVPVAIPFGVALTPLFAAVLGGLVANRVVFAAVAGEAVDPEQKVRIVAEGAGEAMSLDLFGALVTAAAAASVAGSVDVAASWREPGKRPALGSVAAGVVGGVWVLVAGGLALARARSAGVYVLLEPIVIAGLVPFAVLAGRAAPVLREWHDGREASRALGAVLVAGVAAVTAALALELAVRANVTSTALEAISGEAVDPSQRALVLAEAIAGRSLGGVAAFAHVVLGAATFAVALAPGVGRPRSRLGQAPGGVRHPATGSALAALGLAVVAAAAVGAVGASRARSAAAIARAGDLATPAGVQLPVVREDFSNKAGGGANGIRVVVKRDGSGEPSGPGEAGAACFEGKAEVTVYADAAATVGSVRARVLEAARCPALDVGFVVRRAHDPALEARLGELAPYLGSVGYVRGAVTTTTTPAGETVLVVRTIDDDAAEVAGRRVKLPADGGAATGADLGAIGAARVVRYVFAEGDTVARVVKTVTAVEEALRGTSLGYDASRELDLASPPAPSGPPPAPPPAPRGGRPGR